MLTENDFSIKFGEDPSMGFEDQVAFPFMYTFVNRENDEWEPSTNPAIASPLTHIGPTIVAGATKTIPVVLDPDYNFKLISIRYTAYYLDTRTQLYYWNSGDIDDSDPSYWQYDMIGRPLTYDIKAAVSFQGSGSQYLYGGQQPLINSPAGTKPIPLPVETIQGYGMATQVLRTPRILPRQGIILFEITNNHASYALTVGAMIYGMKVRV